MNNIWWLFWGLRGHCWPALPCPLNLASAAESTASALVQCSASALVLCTASAVTRAIYRHSLSIGNKTSAGCLAARCMVQNDLFTSKSSKSLSYIFFRTNLINGKYDVNTFNLKLFGVLLTRDLVVSVESLLTVTTTLLVPRTPNSFSLRLVWSFCNACSALKSCTFKKLLNN